MKNFNDIWIINTDALDHGRTSVRHIKSISYNVVIGTNVFSDILGTIISFFGGRAIDYENKITKMQDIAIKGLKAEARNIGCDGIVGLKTDFEVLATVGRTMFIMTAFGTAVKTNFTVGTYPTKMISSSDLSVHKKKKNLVQKAMEKRLKWNREVWNFAIQHQVQELFDSFYSDVSIEIALGIWVALIIGHI